MHLPLDDVKALFASVFEALKQVAIFGAVKGVNVQIQEESPRRITLSRSLR
jgi:hypothetical protein